MADDLASLIFKFYKFFCNYDNISYNLYFRFITYGNKFQGKTTRDNIFYVIDV